MQCTEDGHRYYVHPESGEVSWDKPSQLAWLAARSDEHEREYYYNTVTKVLHKMHLVSKSDLKMIMT